MPLPDLAGLKGQLYLLWDACLHRNLAQTLYQLDNRVFMLPLYQGTQFESLGDIQLAAAMSSRQSVVGLVGATALLPGQCLAI